jgi:ankyrin repeat protein
MYNFVSIFLLSFLSHFTTATGTPKTLLSLAAEKGSQHEEIQAFLDSGSDPNSLTPDGESVLHLACIWGGPKKVAALLAAGSDPNARNTKHKSSLDMTPLSWCAYAGYTDTISEFLKDERTNVNLIVKQEDGQCISPMDIAIKIGQERGESTQTILKEAGALKYEELKFLPKNQLDDLLPPSGCP